MEQITLPARVDHLADVFSFVKNAASGTGLNEKQLNNLNIAVEEIFVNIAHYAYPSGEGDVTVSVSDDADKFIIEFKDCGTPYNPLAKPDPNTSSPACEREIGGLGIYMVKQMMDSVKYRHESGKNVLTIEKRADGGR